MLVRSRHLTLSDSELDAILDSGPNDQVAFLGAKVSAQAIAETLAALATEGDRSAGAEPGGGLG
jgi:hypothetical protein